MHGLVPQGPRVSRFAGLVFTLPDIRPLVERHHIQAKATLCVKEVSWMEMPSARETIDFLILHRDRGQPAEHSANQERLQVHEDRIDVCLERARAESLKEAEETARRARSIAVSRHPTSRVCSR